MKLTLKKIVLHQNYELTLSLIPNLTLALNILNKIVKFVGKVLAHIPLIIDMVPFYSKAVVYFMFIGVIKLVNYLIWLYTRYCLRFAVQSTVHMICPTNVQENI